MKYQATVVGVDPEWDEPGFVVLHPASLPVRTTLHDYNPEWDYTLESPSRPLVAATAAVLGRLAPVTKMLGVGAPRVFFAELSDRGHVARYVNGTSAEPMIAIDPEVFRRVPKAHWQEELDRTLRHELGHAYLDSRGASTWDEAEEDAVEEFAQTGQLGPLRRFGR